MTKTKKVRAAGRFGAGYGLKSKKKFIEIENRQRKWQDCPFCKKPRVKRVAKGIWECNKCGKKFASDTFYLQ